MPEWLTNLLTSPVAALLDLVNNLWWLLGLISAALIWVASYSGLWCSKNRLRDWCRQLGYDDKDAQRKARQKLIGCRGRAVLPLVDVLRDDRRQSLAVEILCEIGTPALKPLLAERKDEDVARLIDDALEKYLPKIAKREQHEQEYASVVKRLWNRLTRAERISDRLIALLDDGDPFVQEGAALALGRLSHPAAIKELGRKLYPTECRDSQIRKIAVQSLEQTKRPEAIPYLTMALRDRSRDVRLAACQALRHFSQPEAMHALEDVLLPDDNLSVQMEAAKALGFIGGPEAIRFLEKVQAVLEKYGDHSELYRVVSAELA